MIPTTNVRILLLVPCVLTLLNACQGTSEPAPVVPKLSASHRTVKEKTVVVPPEVARTWRGVVISVIDKSRATENNYTVPIGSVSQIPSTTLSISVEAFLPAFIMEGTSITSSSNKLDNPGAKVRITDNGSPVYSGWLFAKYPNTHAVTHPRYGFSLVAAMPATK